MKFKEWKEWYKALPKSMRWFVWLVLLRPLVDNFYYLKEVSPFYSPLYIVGVLTPLFIFISIGNSRRPPQSIVDGNFRVYVGFSILGIVVMAMTGIADLKFWMVTLKITAILYLFFFLRHFIRNRKDMDGLLQTFLYSSILVVFIFFYEVLVHPINLQYTRGIERFQGNYADVFNYATYVSICTLINYYFLLNPYSSLSRSTRIRNVGINIILASAMLLKMSHVATYIIFLALNVLYFLIAFKKNAVGILIFASVLLLIVYFYGQENIIEKIQPLIQKDINISSGIGEETSYLHGRVGRWEWMMDFFNNSSLLSQLFGLPFTGELNYTLITSGTHNDYLRILMLVGYVGLTIYLFFLISLFRRIIKEHLSVLYIGMGALGILVLYSISVVPTIYPGFLYCPLAIFAYFSIPESVLRKQEITKSSEYKR